MVNRIERASGWGKGVQEQEGQACCPVPADIHLPMPCWPRHRQAGQQPYDCACARADLRGFDRRRNPQPAIPCGTDDLFWVSEVPCAVGIRRNNALVPTRFPDSARFPSPVAAVDSRPPADLHCQGAD